jgi:hypothetical protein
MTGIPAGPADAIDAAVKAVRKATLKVPCPSDHEIAVAVLTAVGWTPQPGTPWLHHKAGCLCACHGGRVSGG